MLMQSGKLLIAEHEAQSQAKLQKALGALQAEGRRLHAAAALIGSEGLAAAVPVIADLCVLHEYEHVLQLSSGAPMSSVPSSSLASAMAFQGIQNPGSTLGAVLVDCKGGSGSFKLAETLLGRASQLRTGSVHEADLAIRRVSLHLQLHALTGQVDWESSTAELFGCLQSGDCTLATHQHSESAVKIQSTLGVAGAFH